MARCAAVKVLAPGIRLSLALATVAATQLGLAQTKGANSANSGSFTKQFGKLSPSVVAIYASISKDKAAQGTGFVISPTEIVTDYHVVSDAKQIAIRTAGHIAISGAVIESCSDAMDLAVLKLPRSLSTPPLEVASSLPKVGEKTFVIGSPLGFHQSLTDGIVSSVQPGDIASGFPSEIIAGRQEKSHEYLIQLSTPVSHASSGAPVFNSGGRVIGVVEASISGGQRVKFATSSLGLIWLMNNPGLHFTAKKAPQPEAKGPAAGNGSKEDVTTEKAQATQMFAKFFSMVATQVEQVDGQAAKDLQPTSDPVMEADVLFNLAKPLEDTSGQAAFAEALGDNPLWTAADTEQLFKDQSDISQLTIEMIRVYLIALSDLQTGSDDRYKISYPNAVDAYSRLNEEVRAIYRHGTQAKWFDAAAFESAADPAVYATYFSPLLGGSVLNWWPDAVITDSCRVYFAKSESIFHAGDEVEAFRLTSQDQWISVSNWKDLKEKLREKAPSAASVQMKVDRKGQEVDLEVPLDGKQTKSGGGGEN